MRKLTKKDRDMTHKLETNREGQSKLSTFLNEEAVTFGKLRVNNLTVILLCAILALHNPMPALALIVLFSLRSMLRYTDAKDKPTGEQKG